MRKWIVRGLVLAGLGLAAWAFLRTRPVLVDTGTVTRGPVRSVVEEEGRTRVRERFVVSAPVAGRLLRVGLEEGDTVEKGRLLAEIDRLELQSRVAETEAQVRALRHRVDGVERRKPKPEEIERARVLAQRAEDALEVARREHEQARAVLEKATKDLARVRDLVRSGTTPDEELDAAETAHVQAREAEEAARIRIRIRELEVRAAALETRIVTAQLEDYDWQERDYRAQMDALEATLAALRDDLARTRITAPVDGVVLSVLTESEQVVAAGTPVLEIGDLDAMEVIADFLSEDAARMEEGMDAELFGRGVGDTPVPARVTRIYPSAFRKISSLGVEQQRVNVLLSYDPKTVRLGDEYRVEVRVILDRRDDALLVPEGALFRLEDRWHVFRVSGGRARLAEVRTGLRGGRVREVLEGLEEGDTVILHPEDAVKDGAPVDVVGEE